jgi:hypothetical protein
MPSDWFLTASGRRVLLEQFHVERFALGVLEGRPDLIRRIQIERLPERIRELFPGRTAYLVVAPPVAGAGYPRYVLAAALESFEPVGQTGSAHH